MRIRILACFLAAFSLIAQEREAPPPLGTPKPFAIPAGETFTLPNGMKLTLAQYGAVPLLSVHADIAFGHGSESADRVWISDFLTEMMKEGTASLTAQQIAN
jgi:predicted Zn-dependent peptidase